MESPREPPRRGSLSSMLRLAPQRKLRSSPDVEDGGGDDDRTPRAAEGSPSIASFGTGVLPTWLTPPVLAPPVQGRRSVESVVWYATIACVALLTFYMLVAPEDMDARYARLAAADAHIPRRLARFEVSSDVVDNLGVVDVEYEYAQPQPGFFGRDRIAAYCVDGDGNDTVPDVLDYMAAVPTDGTPSGVVRVGPLINIRCLWVLRFIVFVGDKDTSAVALGQPKRVSFVKEPAQPLQLHLAPTQDPYAMRVQWVSANVTRPVVRFGMDSDNLTRVARATEATYRASDLCELRPVESTDANMNPLQAGFRDPGFIFDAVMPRLIPQKVYYYRVGDEATGIMSDEYSFQLPPPPGHQNVAIDEAEMDPYYRGVDGEDHKRRVAMAFLVFGDLNRPVGVAENFTGGATAASRTVTSMTNDILERNGWRKFVAAFHVGDLSRAMGVGYVWDQFGQLIEPVAARVPYLVAVGNHDYGYQEGAAKNPAKAHDNPTFEDNGVPGFDANGECGVPASRRFHMPESGNSIFWYSTDIGLTHHVIVSSEHDFSVGSRMYAWLIADLMTVDRAKTPWVFLYIHRPMYSSSAASLRDYYTSLLVRSAFEEVIATYRVDIVFSGHPHSYERSCPVFDELCYTDKDSGRALAPVHIVVGSSGNKRDESGFYSSSWRAQGLDQFGYTRVHVFNATHAQIEFVVTDSVGDASASGDKDIDGAVMDAAWIVSDHKWPNDRVRRHRYTTLELSVLSVSGLLFAGVVVYILYLRRASSAKTDLYNRPELRA